MRERSQTEYLGGVGRGLVPMREIEEEELHGSVTAAISEHRVRLAERPDEDPEANAIYEMPDEDEHASSPPRSLSNQDVMSEDITARMEIHKFHRHTQPKLAQSVFPDGVSDDVSKQVQESQAQKNLPPFARVSKTVELVETSRSIQTFKMTYDRLFKKFQERLVNEYGAMRGGYMGEFQLNYDHNSSRRDDRLIEMNMAIEGQIEYARDLDRI